MSRALRLNAAIVTLLMLGGVASAKECYSLADDPSWTITINDEGSDPEWVWKQGEKTVEIWTGSAGTSIPIRVASDQDGNASSYMFHKGDLIVDMAVYEPADAALCKD